MRDERVDLHVQSLCKSEQLMQEHSLAPALYVSDGRPGQSRKSRELLLGNVFPLTQLAEPAPEETVDRFRIAGRWHGAIVAPSSPRVFHRQRVANGNYYFLLLTILLASARFGFSGPFEHDPYLVHSDQ